MSVVQQNSAQGELTNAMRRQHHLGAVNRATRELINSQCHDDVFTIVQQLCCSFGVSGFLYLNAFNFRQVRKIECGLPRNQIRTLMKLLSTSDKVSVDEDLFAFKYTNLQLIVHQNQAYRGDSIQDDMVLFLDSADVWLKKHDALLRTETMIRQRLNDFQQTLQQDLQTLGSKRELIVNRMLTDMASLLPMLGLEPDQEDDIYDAITPIVSAMSQALDHQTSSNHDLFGIVEHLLHQLKGSPAVDSASLQSGDIELF